MVAYTSPDCLPYFECTDSPCLNTGTECDPSTVWCDLVNLLDTRLTGFAATLGRTESAVPFIKVARNAALAINTLAADPNLFIPWDTVLVDNDDSVNLDADPYFVAITTPGIWHFEGYVVGTPPATNGNTLISALADPSSGQYALSETTFRTTSSTYPRWSLDEMETAATIALLGSVKRGIRMNFSGTTGTGIINVTYAELTAYWVADQ